MVFSQRDSGNLSVTILAAVADNGVIGKADALPWYLPEDLKRFKAITKGNVVVMGRKTYESILKRLGSPLPERTNIVITNQQTLAGNPLIAHSIDEALVLARSFGKNIFVIGGQQIYGQMLDRADVLELTHIHAPYEGDVHFPFLSDAWSETKRESYNGALPYSFVRYERKPLTALQVRDSVVYEAIQNEHVRQKTTLNMIPSENYASAAVREACGSSLMNKYSEGYPAKRYYQGNAYADIVEQTAIDRAKRLFGADHVNVQPYSGSPANIAILNAFLKPGEPFMGLDLAAGGHLTHGSPVNASGMLYKAIPYTLDAVTQRLDMNAIRAIALREKPKLIISGLTAYPRTIDFAAFQAIAEEVGAIHLADISHIAGLVAGGMHPSPFPFTDVVMTTTHKTLRGPRGAIIMCKEKHAKQIDKSVFPGMQGGPHENIIAAKAVAFNEALDPSFKAYASQVVRNAQALAETLIREGLVLVTGGTDNHLILIDLRALGQGRGKEIAQALEQAGIVCNANSVPHDSSPPFKPSGLRMGTPMLTTLGMQENEMRQIGRWIASVIRDPTNVMVQASIKKDVELLCARFPFD